MESYLPISFLNDFVFCPRSIYFHQLYGKFNSRLYHESAQVKGLAAHLAIDQGSYSSANNILQGIEVYCQKLNIGGKIDTYDIKSGILRERKKKIKVIYDGYVFQIYAQYFALQEMGYEVKALVLYSMDDNCSYPIAKPEENSVMLDKFNQLIISIREFSLDSPFIANSSKCKRCIYAHLCDHALC